MIFCTTGTRATVLTYTWLTRVPKAMQDGVKDGSLTIPQNNIINEDLFHFQLFFVFSIFDRNVEIVFSEFKKQNNFDELKSRKVLWKIFRICRLHYFCTKFNDKEEEDQFTKNVCARSGRLLRVSGKLQAIARKTANRCTS